MCHIQLLHSHMPVLCLPSYEPSVKSHWLFSTSLKLFCFSSPFNHYFSSGFPYLSQVLPTSVPASWPVFMRLQDIFNVFLRNKQTVFLRSYSGGQNSSFCALQVRSTISLLALSHTSSFWNLTLQLYKTFYFHHLEPLLLHLCASIQADFSAWNAPLFFFCLTLCLPNSSSSYLWSLITL